MNFKIPHSILYLATGLNLGIFFLGLALGHAELSILAVLSIALCMHPIIFETEEEE
jgi:hypothetical protein